MKTVTILLLVGLGLCLALVDGQIVEDPERCPGPNEVLNQCASACPDLRPGQNCIAVCVEKCQCKSGYFRNSEGTCVPQGSEYPG
ncbi:chymotrypsin-elastase inhibitor ixodidin-like [Discoglossus pictus]